MPLKRNLTIKYIYYHYWKTFGTMWLIMPINKNTFWFQKTWLIFCLLFSYILFLHPSFPPQFLPPKYSYKGRNKNGRGAINMTYLKLGSELYVLNWQPNEPFIPPQINWLQHVNKRDISIISSLNCQLRRVPFLLIYVKQTTE